MKRRVFRIAALVLALALSACGAAGAEHGAPEVTKEEARTVDRAALPGDPATLQDTTDRYNADRKAPDEDKLTAFLSDAWLEIYMNKDYRLYIDGKDLPEELPVAGKHAFVVLGFELQDGEMTEELRERCNAAAAAAKSFPESILVCSGGATGENNPEGHTEAGLMKEYLVQSCGIAGERILTDESAMTTPENAINTISILKDQEIEEITIVTSSYHQRRANILYETLLEIVRETEGINIAIVGNYGCEMEAPPEIARYDAWIAATQLQTLLSAYDTGQ